MAAGPGRGGTSRAGCLQMVAQIGFGYPLLVWAFGLPHRPKS
jgi:hypothetical protein